MQFSDGVKIVVEEKNLELEILHELNGLMIYTARVIARFGSHGGVLILPGLSQYTQNLLALTQLVNKAYYQAFKGELVREVVLAVMEMQPLAFEREEATVGGVWRSGVELVVSYAKELGLDIPDYKPKEVFSPEPIKQSDAFHDWQRLGVECGWLNSKRTRLFSKSKWEMVVVNELR